MKKNIFKGLAMLGCLTGLVLCGTPAVNAAETTILTGKVMNIVTRNPTTHFHGILEEVLVKPGQHVSVGDPLLKYSLQEEQRRTLQREVNNGAGVEGMEAQITDLQRERVRVEAQRNKARSLASSGLGSSQASGRLDREVAAIDYRITLIKRSMEKARYNFGVRLKELSGYFDQPIKEGQELPEFLYLKSPLDGYVLNASTAGKGAQIGAGFSPCLIGQMDPLLISVPVYEGDISSIKVGDKAIVEIPSLRDKKFEATVHDIAWISNDMNVANASYYNVSLTIPNPNLELKPGFKAIVRFGGK